MITPHYRPVGVSRKLVIRAEVRGVCIIGLMLKFTKNKEILALAAAVLLYSPGVQAAVFTVIGPCSEKPVFQSDFSLNGSSVSAGELSARIFKENALPFEGDAEGFTSIMGSSSGMAAVEVVSPGKMRFYGWCFSADGVLPAVRPCAFYPDGAIAQLAWFYAFSTYENGVWTDSCVPSYTVKAAQLCGQGTAGRAGAGGIIPVGRSGPAPLRTAFESLAGAVLSWN